MDISPIQIGDFSIRSRLFVGTGKYLSGGEPDYEMMRTALEASGCQVVTVAVRRERLIDKQGRSLLDFLDRIHHEGSIRHNRLAKWRTRYEHKPHTRLALDFNLVTVTKYR